VIGKSVENLIMASGDIDFLSNCVHSIMLPFLRR